MEHRHIPLLLVLLLISNEFAFVKAVGRATPVAIEMTADGGPTTESEATAVVVEPGDCVVLYKFMPALKGIRLQTEPAVWPGTIITGRNLYKNSPLATDYGCWVDHQNQIDRTGERCVDCHQVTAGQPLNSYCLETERITMVEYYNDRNTTLTFKYFRASLVDSNPSLGRECGSTRLQNQCTASHLPTCYTPADGSGGVITGSTVPQSGDPCTCKCLGDWYGEGCALGPVCDTLAFQCGSVPCDGIKPKSLFLYNNDRIGIAKRTVPMRPNYIVGSTLGNTPGGSPFVGVLCEDGYQPVSDVNITCPAQNGMATLTNQICVPINGDCVTKPCPETQQSCIDSDGVMNGEYSCVCNPPLSGMGVNQAALCLVLTGVPETDSPPTAIPTMVPTAGPTSTPDTDISLVVTGVPPSSSPSPSPPTPSPPSSDDSSDSTNETLSEVMSPISEDDNIDVLVGAIAGSVSTFICLTGCMLFYIWKRHKQQTIQFTGPNGEILKFSALDFGGPILPFAEPLAGQVAKKGDTTPLMLGDVPVQDVVTDGSSDEGDAASPPRKKSQLRKVETKGDLVIGRFNAVSHEERIAYMSVGGRNRVQHPDMKFAAPMPPLPPSPHGGMSPPQPPGFKAAGGMSPPQFNIGGLSPVTRGAGKANFGNRTAFPPPSPPPAALSAPRRNISQIAVS